MTNQSPFDVLSIAPTPDLSAVKRAYFSLLAKHTPHQDPEGFRRLRSAYEALTAPGAIEFAYITSPVQVEAELNRWNGRFSAQLKRVAEESQQRDLVVGAVTRFIEGISRMTLSDALLSLRCESLPEQHRASDLGNRKLDPQGEH